MQDFSPTADIENEIKTVISDDNFSGENGEILGLKNPKKVRGELVASEGMERDGYTPHTVRMASQSRAKAAKNSPAASNLYTVVYTGKS